jgi:adenylate kinase family enzyme
MLQRIHIIGGPGSGKTYAARKLSHHLNIPAYDLDDLFWDITAGSYGVRMAEADRSAKLDAILDNKKWIIEGVYYHWLRRSFEQADCTFVLRPNVYLRDWHILKRFGSRKLGIAKTKSETLLDLCQLIRWNHGYDEDNLKRALEFMHELQAKTVLCSCGDDLIKRVIGDP